MSNNTNMKIILVIATLTQGGAERVMSELANQWTREKHDVHIVLLAKSELFYKLNEDVIVHQLGFENRNPLQKIFSEINVFFKLRRLLKNETPDFVMSFMTKYNIFTIIASSFLKLKIFVSDRSNPNKQLPFIIKIMRNISYRFTAGIIAQTTLSKDLLKNTIKDANIKVIPNPVKKIHQYPLIKREKIILNIGRLIPQKGQSYLIDAFSLINDMSYKLVILGEGPLRKDLEKQIEFLGLKNRVLMPGSVVNVDEWLAKASIFAFSSVSEGFPNALIEAMAAGLPCVSFDCDAGPRDIIVDNVNGFLIPEMNINLMSDKIKELIINPNLRIKIGREALKINTQLDKEIIAQKYLLFMKCS